MAEYTTPDRVGKLTPSGIKVFPANLVQQPLGYKISHAIQIFELKLKQNVNKGYWLSSDIGPLFHQIMVIC